MKQKIINKIVIPCAIVPLCTATFISCGAKTSGDAPYEKMAKILCEDVKNEFISLSTAKSGETEFWKHHRSTFNTEPFITHYLKPRIEEIFEENGKQKPTFVDIAYNPGAGHEADRIGYNFYFDIPANNLGAELPPILIQCHTDMVWKYDTSQNPEASDAPGINITQNWANNTFYTEPVRQEGGGILYGKTTLGADNGIGIATALALCIHSDEFNHGVIRCLFTTDEEDGPSGASAIKERPDVFLANGELINYCLNIDLEDNHIMARSCGGTQTALWKLTYSGEDEFKSGCKLLPLKYYYSNSGHIYKLDVTGLLGGHSGLDINKNRLNAPKFAAQILSSINWNGLLRLVSFTTNGDESETLHYSSIPTQAHVVFATNLEKRDVEPIVQACFNSARSEHPSENKIEFKLSEVDKIAKKEDINLVTVMGRYDTNQFIRFLSETLVFGPISFLESGAIQTCANIGTVLFRPNSDDWRETYGCSAQIALQGRSSDIDQLGRWEEGTQDPEDPKTWEGFMNSFYRKSLQVFGTFGKTAGITFDSWTPPWSPREDDVLQNIILQSASDLGQTIRPSDEPGWLEVAYFLEAQKDLNIACIGPKIDNAHSIHETLHTDTIVPMLRLLLSTLDHLPAKIDTKGGNNNE